MSVYNFKCPICREEIQWDEADDKSILCLVCCTSLIITQSIDGTFILKEDKEEGLDDVNWDLLVHKIIKGEVIPIIGEDLVLDGNRTVRQMFVTAMSKTDNINLSSNSGTLSQQDKSYSELIYHPDYKKSKENIYGRISNLVAKYQKAFKPSDLLKRVLSIKQFPFIITTCTDSVIENTMREIWGQYNRTVKTLVFTNDPNEIDKSGDLVNELDIDNPTIYYMFGKANTNIPHKFVVTDEDMLSFCQAWLTEGIRPKLLSRAIARKSLLFLGCNYPDWLVRFIWYSMRNDLEKSGMIVAEAIELSLEEFMKRVHVETQRNPEFVIKQIEDRLKEKMAEINSVRFDKPMERTDVFISYSRTDEDIAKKLYETLSQIGLNVWYDRKNLAAGDKWLEKIKRAIESTKFFVAIVSEEMKLQVNDSHVYRKEWNMAIEYAKGMGSRRGFIIPVTLGNVDFYDHELDLPDGLTGHNAINLKQEEDFIKISKEILERINGLTNN